MRNFSGGPPQGQAIPAALAAGALGLLAIEVVGGLPTAPVTVSILLGLGFALAHRHILAWPSLIGLAIAVILFIPIRRYALPGGLPFQLEPYRLLIAFLVAGWLASLLVDPRVRLRATGLEGPILAIALAVLGSVVINGPRVTELSTDVTKKLTFFLSFLLVLYLIASVVRTRRALDALITTLVSGGMALSVLTIIESRTGFNVFDHLSGVIPFLHLTDIPRIDSRGARLRALASAQHPIALGAALVMLVPLAIYLARRQRRRIWLLAAGLLLLAPLATVSRTSVVMLLVMILVFLWLRPRETKRLWPLIIPVLVISHLLLPGTLGALKSGFLPAGGLISEQERGSNTYGSGRLADLGPGLSEFADAPLLGKGFGTLITDQERANSPILDDQWLGTLLETGLVGGLGWAWLFGRTVRRLGRAAKEDDSPRGWLLTGIAASTLAFAVGMWTYDAFSFIQVTFLLFMLLAFGSVVLSLRPDSGHVPVRSSPAVPPPSAPRRPARVPRVSAPRVRRPAVALAGGSILLLAALIAAVWSQRGPSASPTPVPVAPLVAAVPANSPRSLPTGAARPAPPSPRARRAVIVPRTVAPPARRPPPASRATAPAGSVAASSPSRVPTVATARRPSPASRRCPSSRSSWGRDGDWGGYRC
jgi:hypothetical protein